MNVLAIGASRNIGYFSAKRLLDKGATVTFLLRNTSCFDNDETIQSRVKEGRVKLVQGDALKVEDIKKAVDASNEIGKLDTVLFTVGGLPEFKLTQGIKLPIPDLCTRSFLNLVAALKSHPILQSAPPKVILVSSNGIGKTGHDALPCLVKPLYKYGLASPHADKLGLERVAGHVAGFSWPAQDGEPDTAVLSSGWEERAGSKGWLKDRVTIVRPALLTDGACAGDKKVDAYRIATEAEIKSGYTVSRQDIAHCIVEKVIADWNQWGGKILRVAY